MTARSYVVIRPDGKRVYVEHKKPVAYVVFALRVSPPDPAAGWERVQIVEDRAYLNENHRVDGAYVPHPGPMLPEKKAREVAVWWSEVAGNHEAAVVETRPARAKRRRS